MKPLTSEWVGKAEGDYATARREMRARRQPNYDAACFHAQQCAEKYLKALLQEFGHTIVRTHNLETLATPLSAAFPALHELAPRFRALTAYAVESRYPGKSSDRALARDAVAHCGVIRTAMRKALRIRR